MKVRRQGASEKGPGFLTAVERLCFLRIFDACFLVDCGPIM